MQVYENVVDSPRAKGAVSTSNSPRCNVARNPERNRSKHDEFYNQHPPRNKSHANINNVAWQQQPTNRNGKLHTRLQQYKKIFFLEILVVG